MKTTIQLLAAEKHSVGSTPFQRLALHSAVAVALLGGAYGRAAYAGSCRGNRIATCSGPANAVSDITRKMIQPVLTVRTTAGFGIDTTATAGDGFYLVGYDGLTFTDNNSSLITGRDHGIYAFSKGSGALSITSSGVVTGIEDEGIFATSVGAYHLDTTIHTAVVTGGNTGIFVRSSGIGGLSITSTGTVTGIISTGIWADNTGTGAAGLTLQTVAVTGGTQGIEADNNSGALSITSSGVVTAADGDGIFAANSGTDLILHTPVVNGSNVGINVSNGGSGALRIESDVAVTSIFGDGISAFNSSRGTDLTVQTAIVTGGKNGIDAFNSGSGVLRITSSDSVTSAGGDGISAMNFFGSEFVIQTSVVRGSESGIDAFNRVNGALNITSSAEVSGTRRDGISAVNYGTNLSVVAAAVTG